MTVAPWGELSGRRVAQILGKAGERFAWEGKSDTGVLVEPGVYLQGLGGVRIEDTLVVRAGTEPAELLTTTTKELLVV